MKILITGGAGFVGSTLAIQLKDKYPEYQIIALDNLKRNGAQLNLGALTGAGISFVHGDVRCREDLEQLEKFDVLVDASAEPSVLAGLTGNPFYVINNNLLGSVNCFDLCLKHAARLIFLSTSRVYPIERIENAKFDVTETRFSFAENQVERGISASGISEELDIRGYRSFYGATKLSAEILLEEYAANYGLQTAVTRFGVIAGPRQMAKSDQGIATLWLAKHYWKRELKYIGYGGNGKQVRDILHVDDLVRLVDTQIHKPELFTGTIFNAGGGLTNSVSLQEMTVLCQQITGNKINIASEIQERSADLRCFITDNSKVQRQIGWAPEKKLETTFEDIFTWIMKNENTLKPILA